MEAYTFTSQGPLTVTLRNVGSASADLAPPSGADYFINGVHDSNVAGTCGSTVTPEPSCTAIVSLSSYASLISGAAYPFKIVTPSGGVFSYSVIYGGGS